MDKEFKLDFYDFSIRTGINNFSFLYLVFFAKGFMQMAAYIQIYFVFDYKVPECLVSAVAAYY